MEVSEGWWMWLGMLFILKDIWMLLLSLLCMAWCLELDFALLVPLLHEREGCRDGLRRMAEERQMHVI